MGICGYLDDWDSGGGEQNAPECNFYGIGGWCLGETIDDCGYSITDTTNQSAETTKNLIYKINIISILKYFKLILFSFLKINFNFLIK